VVALSHSVEALQHNLAAVRRAIDEAAARVGRGADEVSLVAVTKTVDVETVHSLSQLGQHRFGENRADELRRKVDECPDEEFHYIGSLQTNKVRHVVGVARLIHSVDSDRLLDAIALRAAAIGEVQPVLLQVNVSSEGTKHGFRPEDVERVIDRALVLDSVEVRGLMTMAPLADAESVRWVFSSLRKLRDHLETATSVGVQLGELSMGMSNDYEVAIEEGATLVRVGSALYRD